MFKKRDAPSDYCLLDSAPEGRLTQFERLTLVGGSELERAVAWLARQFSEIDPGTDFGKIDVPAILSAAEFYSEPGWSAAPESFFLHPSRHPDIELLPVHGLKDGQVSDIRFRSSYEPRNPLYLEEFQRNEENRNVYARIWKHDGGARSCLIAIHGWTMGDQRINSLAFLPGIFYDLGVDVVLIELPFHGRRRARNLDETSQFLFPNSNLVRTNESIGQVISDLRDLHLYLASIGCSNIGCIGMSLGGYVASLWASLDPLNFCIPIVPMVSMPELFWHVLSGRPEFRALKREGLEIETFHKVFRVHSPLAMTSRVARERSMIIAGIGDKIVPARQPIMLWEHWGRPKLYRFSGGHVTHISRSKALLEILAFMSALNLLDGPRLQSLIEERGR